MYGECRVKFDREVKSPFSFFVTISKCSLSFLPPLIDLLDLFLRIITTMKFCSVFTHTRHFLLD